MKTKKQLIFNADNQVYTIKLKDKKLWWLWIIIAILLLLILLLVPFNKTIIIKTIDDQSKIPLQNKNVALTYTDFRIFNFKTHKFFTLDTVNQKSVSDTNGITKFNTHYTLAELFYSTIAKAYAYGGCFQSDTTTVKYFHIPKIWILPMHSRKTSVDFIVLDADDKEPIPQATVKLVYFINGKQKILNAKTLANGSAIFLNIPYCIDSIHIQASKYGYLPYNINNSDFSKLLSDIKNRNLFLKPIKKRIEFFVRDLYTQEAIANATVEMTMGSKSYILYTNTNGIGRGAFDSIPIAETIHFHIMHPAYHDTTTKNYSVANFIKYDIQKRTFYIRPLKTSLTFKNTDITTKEPLPGVQNIVYVNGDSIGVFYSNQNGTFKVPGLNKNDIISIKASKPGYESNDYSIKNSAVKTLNTIEKKIIPLKRIPPKPYDTQPPKPNCRVHFSGTLLSDYVVPGHISMIFKPDKYGEYVGAGMYPSNKAAFPNAVKYTFDAIAVDKGTRVIIYSQENFKGKILLDITGPALINNKIWKNDSRINNFITKKFSGGLETIFPKNCRRWSSQNMRDWANGSVKIICTQ